MDDKVSLAKRGVYMMIIEKVSMSQAADFDWRIARRLQAWPPQMLVLAKKPPTVRLVLALSWNVALRTIRKALRKVLSAGPVRRSSNMAQRATVRM